MVFVYRSADSTTVLVAPELRFAVVRLCEVVTRIQIFIAEKVVEVAVEGVRSSLGRQVDNTSIEPPELRRHRIGFNVEFLNIVHDREERHLSRLRLQCGNAIEQILVGSGPPTIDTRKLCALRQRYAWRKSGQLHKVSSIQRHGRN